jgi:hypothetical protein
VGCQNSVHTPGSIWFAGRTEVLTPTPSLSLPTCPQHRTLHHRRRPPRRATRPRRAIGEAFAAPLPTDPLRGSLTRATNQHSRRGDRQPGSNKGNKPLSLAAAESGISMKNHQALLVVATPTSRTLGGLFDVTASADVNMCLGTTFSSPRDTLRGRDHAPRGSDRFFGGRLHNTKETVWQLTAIDVCPSGGRISSVASAANPAQPRPRSLPNG